MIFVKATSVPASADVLVDTEPATRQEGYNGLKTDGDTMR
jgi:hypothetical protein